ncbi:MAG: hypothetical protein ABII85_07540 [Bacillota bacterium]
MNRIARKLVLSALTVVLTVVALGTTTFAWFTLTNTAQVQSFQAQIVADTGIEISLDTVDWYTVITTEIIEAYIDDTTFTYFGHLTTSTGSGTFYTLGLDGVDYVSAATNGWLQIPLYFRSNSATQINWSSITLSATPSSWVADVPFNSTAGTVASGEPVAINASNAMRISATGSIGTIVYEKPNGADGNVALGIGGDLSNAGIGDPGAQNYYYAKTGAIVTGAATVTTVETQTVLSENPVTALVTPSTYGATYGGQIIIRIWLEGWDADAYNSILAEYITAGFVFNGV